nr:hypothetical protein [uncultured Dethiosulfovibrio sp.]
MLTLDYTSDILKTWYKELLEGDERDRRIIRWVALTVMLLSIAGSSFALYRVYNVNPPAPRSMPPVSVEEDRKKVEESVELYRTIIATRRDSQRIANDIVRLGRNPMMKMESPKEVALISPEPSVADLVDLPPIILVRAVMIIGRNSAAVVDIEGVGEGIVIKKGMSFLGGKGRFISIRSKELVFRWNGKNISVPVDL